MLDQHEIHICTILPSVIDTPFFHHAANFSHHPVYTPEKVAHTVVRLAENPRAEVIIGGFGKVAAIQKRLMPSLMTRIDGRALELRLPGERTQPRDHRNPV